MCGVPAKPKVLGSRARLHGAVVEFSEAVNRRDLEALAALQDEVLSAANRRRLGLADRGCG
jgi:hypothetical protein